MTTLSTNTNLNALNAKIVSAMADIRAAAVENNYTYATLESECTYLTARGKERIYLTDLAIALTGTVIARLDNVCSKSINVTIYPSKGKSHEQSLNDTLLMIAVHNVLLDGHIDSKGLVTALENWIDEDRPEVNEAPIVLNCEQTANDLLTCLITGAVLSGEEGTARTSDGAYYKAFGITEEINNLRWETISELWDKAQPRMQPMRHPLRWLHDGTCQLKNLKLVSGYSQVLHPDFTEAFNKLGHTAYTVNPIIREQLHLMVEANEMPELPEDEKQMYKVVEKHRIKMATIDELILLPINTPLYFPHTADWRGRAYARGGLTQFQSIKECRALFDFVEYVQVPNPTGLFLHIANAHDKDKLSINNRVKWVKDNQQSIMSGKLSTGIYSDRAALALAEYKNTGTTNVICHIDGTCNGTQWTAAMYRDKKSAKLVNVTAATHDDEPQDLYDTIAQRAIKLASGKERELLNKYGRNLTKVPIMILGYGASKGTCEEAVNEFLAEHGERGNGKAIYKAIEFSIKIECPSLVTLTNNLTRLLKERPQHRVEWFMPDFKIVAHNSNTEHLNLKGSKYTAKLLGNAIADPEALARGISPNYVHSADSAHLRAVIRQTKEGLSCIHDSVGAPANVVIAVNETIRIEFHRMHKVDMVKNIYDALGEKYTDQRKDLDINEVLQAAYIFS